MQTKRREELAQLCQVQSKNGQPAATALMITNSVEEAIFLSDRILALGRGPAASLSEAIEIPFTRPRPADLMAHNEDAVRIRARLTGFLSSGVRRRTAVNHAQTLSVPVEA